jgi:CxxC motif-containing protein (DUF1111 family)
LISLLLLMACPGPAPQPDWADVFVAQSGDPVPWLEGERLDQYWRGQAVLARSFGTHEGLGPTFNADSCGSCHQFPTIGGSSPRYRDFFLIQKERAFDGALLPAGTNGSPVLNLYATEEAGLHISADPQAITFNRRSAPNGIGVGLLAFVPESEILSRSDPDDADGDGISGRPNYEQGRVGRYGYKAQATNLESFNRGAAFNQMGITTDPLRHDFDETPSDERYAPEPVAQAGSLRGWLLESWIGQAWAQVSAPDEPTVDDDGVADPELSNDDQLDLLIYSTYMGVPVFGQPSADSSAGMGLFLRVGCDSCHTPTLDSTIGGLPAFSDMLLHDMGDELADTIAPGVATGNEWRTQPLWAVSLHGPYLHDGRADTLHQAIAAHGGESQGITDVYLDLSGVEQAQIEAFLMTLGGWDAAGQGLVTPELPEPAAGEAGGPLLGMSASELALWRQGRALFDQNFRADQGLGLHFNADSCRACHRDPVLGGAGGLDVSVIRYGQSDGERFTQLDQDVNPRSVQPGEQPFRMPDEANVVELRQPPTTLGVGLISGIPEDDLLAYDDPEDLDGDGISGRARYVDGQLGRYGWKAQIASVADFVADAMLQEIGVTADPALSDFTSENDDDDIPDPELDTQSFDAVTAYLNGLAPPPPKADVADGALVFGQVGCMDCHAVFEGVPLYSDLMLHEMGQDPLTLVDQDSGALPTEFRTPPLWGVSDTAPYWHDGLSPTLESVVLRHAGEGQGALDAYLELSKQDQDLLLEFLGGL